MKFFVLFVLSRWTVESLHFSNMTCYSCTYYNKKEYVKDSCHFIRKNDTAHVQPCKAIDEFCKVKRVQRHGRTVRIERSCASQCVHRCYWNGIPTLQETCTSCCNQSLCNYNNDSNSIHIFLPVNAFLTFIATLVK